MNRNYEILESFSKDKEIWSYLRHKTTGLEIAFHQCETEETGFSFNFKTPVEDPYLGTSHVLEHCVLEESERYSLSFLELLKLSCYSSFNALTDFVDTKYYFYSQIEEECLKLIPILGDYVFFPKLSEEAFMQECMRVEFDPSGDGRKKKISGVVYNEMKYSCKEPSSPGGAWYKLAELTREKIITYHKKYYRPDNCLLVFNGNLPLEIFLQKIDPLIRELSANFENEKIVPRKNLTIQEFLEKAPFIVFPETTENPELTSWLIDKKDDVCSQIEGYWADGFSPLMAFFLDEKYAYSAYCWWKEHNQNYMEAEIPPKKSVQKIMSEYLGRFSPEEYQAKLDRLYDWQSRDVSKTLLKVMEPLAVSEYDIEFKNTEKELQKYFNDRKEIILWYYERQKEVETIIEKKSCAIIFKPSTPLTKEYYAEFSLSLFLEKYLQTKFRQAGYLYDLNFSYSSSYAFQIATSCDRNPEETLKLLKKFILMIQDYNFTETDMMIIKSEIYSSMFSNTSNLFYSDKVLEVTSEDLHKAAVRIGKVLK